jgi:galactoside O-acetyltransferase
MFLSKEEIAKIGFKSVGENVLLSDKASIYNAANISIGDNSRIDDFCILSAGVGGIDIGKNVHVSCYASLIGAGNITLRNYSCVSVRCSVFSSTDDFTNLYFTNPTVDISQRNVFTKDVEIGVNAVIGAGSVVLPGVKVGEGSSVGAMSLLKISIPPFTIWGGIPAKFIKSRI